MRAQGCPPPPAPAPVLSPLCLGRAGPPGRVGHGSPALTHGPAQRWARKAASLTSRKCGCWPLHRAARPTLRGWGWGWAGPGALPGIRPCAAGPWKGSPGRAGGLGPPPHPGHTREPPRPRASLPHSLSPDSPGPRPLLPWALTNLSSWLFRLQSTTLGEGGQQASDLVPSPCSWGNRA